MQLKYFVTSWRETTKTFRLETSLNSYKRLDMHHCHVNTTQHLKRRRIGFASSFIIIKFTTSDLWHVLLYPKMCCRTIDFNLFSNWSCFYGWKAILYLHFTKIIKSCKSCFKCKHSYKRHTQIFALIYTKQKH